MRSCPNAPLCIPFPYRRYAYYFGARHFLITTRSTDTDKVRSAFSDILTNGDGATLTVMTVDTAKPEDMTRLCDVAKKAKPPLRSVRRPDL